MSNIKDAFDIPGYSELITSVSTTIEKQAKSNEEELEKRLIGKVVITCSCGAELRVPAYSIKRRYCALRTKLAFWKTPFAIELTSYPDEHGMHLIASARLEKSPKHRTERVAAQDVPDKGIRDLRAHGKHLYRKSMEKMKKRQ